MANVENPYQTMLEKNLVVTSGINLNNSIFAIFTGYPSDMQFIFDDYNSETNEYFIGFPFTLADEGGNVIELDNFNINYKMNNNEIPSRKTEDGYYITTNFESMSLDIEIEDPNKTYFFNEDPDTGKKEYSTSIGFNFIPVSVEIYAGSYKKNSGDPDPIYTPMFTPAEAEQFMEVTISRENLSENAGTYSIDKISVTNLPPFITYTFIPGTLIIDRNTTPPRPGG